MLQAEFGTDYEAVGEASYYIMLAELRSAPASAVGRLTSTLQHVRPGAEKTYGMMQLLWLPSSLKVLSSYHNIGNCSLAAA